ncbi:Lipid A biosynthesis lauroyltransferase [Vibrio stylophorae]|uniref:Lipid A biosynthesis acyltransferase n=1 Tax=Vibrio stylophorae TaxID=659351 RepID=A0ABM8ZQC4_9VIBR|nr:LpxL/LpxP family Kdo(2)-lipid IV(A) lauroyl/palmitoleoyl acyltransferase [Vibrio stylophorae]CAH0532490.1 Lipid A biosynthesis lauroyltransferase [Vibrio stylophorae]
MHHFEPPKFTIQWLHPRYWHIWFGMGSLYLISWLPYRLQFWLGRGVGRLLKIVLKSRVKVADRNLQLCFPKMSEQERKAMVDDNFGNSGLAAFETMMAWFWPNWRIKRHVRYEGLEHLYQLQKEGKGALLIAVHSLNLEIGARAFGQKTPGLGVYRPNNNPVYDWFQFHGRVRSNKAMIDRKDVKSMLQALRQGEFLWYAPDHDYGKRRSTFAPLFAVEKANTTTGTSLLANASDCALVPFSIVRNPDNYSYTLRVDPPLDAFPHDDETAAAAYINKAIEKSIMRAPSQYMWLHRRFKTRPEGEPSLY